MYDVIMADCPWRYDFSVSRRRGIERKYDTMSQTDLEEMGHLVRGWAAPACVLFMWCPLPKLPLGLAVMQSWGWRYVTADPWDKQRIGMGYYWRGRHELLMLGTRGDVRAPIPSRRPHGGMYERRGNRHSRKPVCAYDRIEFMYPDAKRLELFARPPFRDGWDVWGHEVDPGGRILLELEG